MIISSFIRCITEEIVIINQIVKVCNRFLCTYFMEYVYFDYYFFRSASPGPPCKKITQRVHANVLSTYFCTTYLMEYCDSTIYYTDIFYVSFDYYFFHSAIETDLGQYFHNVIYIIMF